MVEVWATGLAGKEIKLFYLFIFIKCGPHITVVSYIYFSEQRTSLIIATFSLILDIDADNPSLSRHGKDSLLCREERRNNRFHSTRGPFFFVAIR